MQLEKITKYRQSEEKRRYDDACGLAHALDLLGERWGMLVMRELAYGPRRFSGLKNDLHDISANVLTQRLIELEAPSPRRRDGHRGPRARAQDKVAAPGIGPGL